MKIWKLIDPVSGCHRISPYADAGWRGSWSKGHLCLECNRPAWERIPPLLLVWEPGSREISDFTFVSGTFVATQSVLDFLQSRVRGIRPGPVKMIEEDKKPKNPQRARPRIWLPYEGPPLWELWTETCVHLDPDRTTAKRSKCSLCGSLRYKLTGHERYDLVVHPQAYQMITRHRRRTPGKGLYIRKADLRGADYFGVHEFVFSTFCTDRFKTLVEKQGFTNIEFAEMGDAI